MGGSKRRGEILARLQISETPLSASKLAKWLGVSRQVIVGDVALLRAAGYGISATARGYLLEREETGVVAKIACQHRPDQTEEELSCIVALGGEILDVIVEHPIYGELTGNLRIRTQKDVADFIYALTNHRAILLSELTEGIHLHTIRCQSQACVEAIKQGLLEKHLLYQG